MAKEKKTYVQKTTPEGEFIWPKLHTPDEFKGKKTYNTSFALPADHPWVEKCIKLIDKMADEALAEAVANDKRPQKKKDASPWKLAQKPYENETDKDSGEETGRVLFKFKKNYEVKDYKTGEMKTTEVKMFDGRGKKIRVNPWSGTIGCVSFTFLPYAQGADVGAGVKLGLDAVQIIKLVKGGERDAEGYGFAKRDDAEDIESDEASDDDSAEETKSDVASSDDDEDF